MAKLTWKIWLLIIFLVLSIVSLINFSAFSSKGVVVTDVVFNSTAFDYGFSNGQKITAIDGEKINSLEDYTFAISNKYSSSEKVKTIFTTDAGEIIYFSNHAPNMTLAEISSTNLKLGLDLAGGARALVKAQDQELTSSQVNNLVDVVRNRFNVYGLSDVNVLSVSDLSGEHFMLIEIAGATPSDLQNLISQQGEFVAKIGNETVFEGGEKDIASVCRNDATCAVIEGCFPSDQGNYFCNFRFSVYLSENAAEKHADITKDLAVNSSSQGNFLSKSLDLYLDGNLVDSLLISEGLKGRVTTQISISGSGEGTTRQEALENTEEEMHHLQTILITGSLPYKLEIVKLDTISPILGKEFLNAIIIAGITALLVVSIIVFVRYKKIKSSLALLLTSFSEILIILGIASLIEWNLDLPSIAGILATIGTGIDQQIIIIDESKHSVSLSLKQKMKRAFAIILGAYFTTVVSLIPLLWAGAGLLKGFAITTIIGISVGILITRPAFTDIIKKIEE